MLSSSWYLLFWTAQNISFVRLQMSLQIGRIPQGSTCSSPWKIHTRQLKVHTCRSTKATEGKMYPTKCLSSNNKYFLTVCWYICHTLKMPSLTAITIHGILDSTEDFRCLLVVTPHDSLSLTLLFWTQWRTSHLCTKAQKHGLIFFSPLNEHACQNASQEITASIGTAAVGGSRLVHPSLWGNRCCHWFTLQACESVCICDNLQ